MFKSKNGITWFVSLSVALFFIIAGYSKLVGTEEMVQVFDLFGLPAWFRIVIGIIEVTGGVLLLIPSLAGFSAFILAILMISAFAFHLVFTPISHGIPAIVILVLLVYIVLVRKNTVTRIFQQYIR